MSFDTMHAFRDGLKVGVLLGMGETPVDRNLGFEMLDPMTGETREWTVDEFLKAVDEGAFDGMEWDDLVS